MAKEFQCRIIDPARKELFISVFGRDTVSVISPMPMQEDLEGRGVEFVYMLDLNEITPEEKERLICALAATFGSPREDVEKDLNTRGLPIMASGCIVTVDHTSRGWL